MEIKVTPTSKQKMSWLVFLIGLLLTLPFLDQAIASTKPLSAKIVLTHQEKGLVPQSDFQCRDMIHGYLVFSEPITKGELQGIWKIPNGSVAEHARISIDFADPGRRTAYLWLEFEQKGGGLLGSVSESDQKDPLYNGEWSLEVLFNETQVVTEKFNVKC